MTQAPPVQRDRSSAPRPPQGAPLPGRAIDPRDALWAEYQYVLLLGPLQGLDAAALRERIMESQAARELLGVRRGARALTWSPVDGDALAGHLREVVVAEELDGSAASVERLLSRPLDGLPVRVVVGAHHVALHTDHVVGDAVSITDLHLWLVRHAVGASAGPLELPTGIATPYRAGLAHSLAWKQVPQALSRTAASVLDERRLRVRLAAPQGWDRVPSIELAAGGTAGSAALKAFRLAHAPGLSNGMAIMAAAWWALVSHGAVEADLRPGIGLDLRRYLPRREYVHGNFTTCVRLPEGTAPHPVSLRDALAVVASSKAPLVASGAQAALGALRARMPSALPRSRSSAVVDQHAPSLVLNFMGRAAVWDSLPWVPGAAQTFVAAPSVDSSRAITVNLHDRFDGFHLTASFFGSVIPRERVRAALDDLEQRLPEVLAAMQDAGGANRASAPWRGASTAS